LRRWRPRRDAGYWAEQEETRAKVISTFKKLRKLGFLARANFTCCSSCGGYEITEMAAERISKGKKQDAIKGCVFWHRQDEDTFKQCGVLYLRYGDMESTELGKIGLPTQEGGRIIERELRAAGINLVEWNGSGSACIVVHSHLDTFKEAMERPIQWGLEWVFGGDSQDA